MYKDNGTQASFIGFSNVTGWGQKLPTLSFP